MTTKASKKPLSVVLVGVGMVSATYADALSKRADQVRLIGALGQGEGSGARFLSQHGEAFGGKALAFGNLAEAIAAQPDFAIVTTPPNARSEIVAAFAHAGIPVLMEKPLERTRAAAEALCDSADAAGVLFGVVLQHRMRPSALALQEIVATGRLGPLYSVEINVPWWRPQSYYDAPGRGSYARDGGGVLINQAIHTLDLALQFTGPVRAVSAFAATTGAHQMESENFVSAGLAFESGAVGHIFASTASYPGRSESISLHYAHASVTLASSLLEIVWQDGRSETIGERSATGAGADPMAFTSDWHGAVIDNFAASVTGEETLAIPARSALAVHRLIEAIEVSARRPLTPVQTGE